MDQFITDLIRNVPPVTRFMLLSAGLLTALTSLDVVSAQSLYFNRKAIYQNREYWRFATSVLYFGDLGIQTLWTAYVLLLYSGKLESDNYHMNKLRFCWRLLFILIVIWIIGSVFPYTPFLSSTFLSTLLYIWSRKNPHVVLNVLFFNIEAPYLSWCMLVFHFLLGQPTMDHLIGIGLGHIVYFLDDIYPIMPASGGKIPLDPPMWLNQFIRAQLGGSDL